MSETTELLSQYFTSIPDGAHTAGDGIIITPEKKKLSVNTINFWDRDNLDVPLWARAALLTGAYEQDLSISPESKDQILEILGTIETNKGKFAAVAVNHTEEGVQKATIYPGILPESGLSLTDDGYINTAAIEAQAARGFTLIELGPAEGKRHLWGHSSKGIPLRSHADSLGFNVVANRDDEAPAELLTAETFASAITERYSPDFAADILITTARNLAEKNLGANAIAACAPTDERVCEVVALRKEQLEKIAELLEIVQTGNQELLEFSGTIEQHRANYDAKQLEYKRHFASLIKILEGDLGSSLLWMNTFRYTSTETSRVEFDGKGLEQASIESGYRMAEHENKDTEARLARTTAALRVVNALI